MAIARLGSITGAAASLRISKSSASQKLSEMEQDLSLKLFQRSTRKITLTPAGKMLLEKCGPAVDGVSRARADFGVSGQRGPEISGRVSIAGSNIYLTEYVVPHLRQFQLDYPNISLRLVGGDTPVDPETDGIDLRIRVGSLDSGGQRVFEVLPIERVLSAAKSTAFVTSKINHPRDLAGLPVILRAQENTLWSFQRGTQVCQFQTPAPQMQVSSYELAVQAVRQGHGIAVLARDIVARDIAQGQMVQLLPDWHIAPLPVALAIPHSKYAKPHVRALADYLRGVLA